ncbi:hypothetical protein EXIGLDRAFT_204170 [Exidia glandulosa HHB12029]|uniref:F-box domain-containing protein n=1 Tax=Exidia glandulosa HHB12029 TaxID=1314781 RepID=A0A165ENP7_EXIGL|nr:hypothetical protein EXIGLDRAFT_204170 [Exidia glandulosa HHB12029]
MSHVAYAASTASATNGTTAGCEVDVQTSAKRSINAALPVARLPAEMLCHAFGYLDIAECITVSAVCHHWREISLGCTILWSNIDARNATIRTHALAELIARSGNAILDFHSHSDFSAAITTQLRANIHRLRALSMLSTGVSGYSFIGIFAGIQAARLEHLDVRAFFCGMSSAFLRDNMAFAGPVEAIEGDDPLLAFSA